MIRFVRLCGTYHGIFLRDGKVFQLGNAPDSAEVEDGSIITFTRHPNSGLTSMVCEVFAMAGYL